MARAVALALALVVVSCAGSKKPPPDFLGEPVPKQCAHDEETEFCIGWWVERLLVSFFGMRPYDDSAIERYVTSVGNRLARVSGDRRRWKFRVLDDPSVQAFVISGSTVYLHRGILAILRSEAELAAVLAHEMGHLRGGHTRENWIGADVQRSELEKSMQHRYDRDDEIQADESAVFLLARAGYDPKAVETMLRALAGTARYDAVEDPDAVHPWWPDRIARTQSILARQAATGEVGEERYRTRVASLIVGPDPRRISVIGTTAVFAAAGAALDLPPFTSSNVDDDRLDVTLAAGGTLRIHAVNADMAKLMAAMAKDDHGVLEVHQETTNEAITISVEGIADAAFLARTLRAAMRAPTRDELARLTPKRVDLNAPRRLWAMAR